MNSVISGHYISSFGWLPIGKSLRCSFIGVALVLSCEAQPVGIDFDVSGPITEADFLSVPATNAKDYIVTHNGIIFDIEMANANLGNEFRWRNNANAGDLMNDFQQWYGRFGTSGNAVEATVTQTGLVANTDCRISFFTYKFGAGQTTHNFDEGASSAASLVTAFTTAGNQHTCSTWRPGIAFQIHSASNSGVLVTIQKNGGREFNLRVSPDSRRDCLRLAACARQARLVPSAPSVESAFQTSIACPALVGHFS